MTSVRAIAARVSSTRSSRIVTSVHLPSKTLINTPLIPLMTSSSPFANNRKPSNRLDQFNKHFSTTATTMANTTTNNNHEFKLESLFDVKGKVALVTGGATGIGLMAVQTLAVNGAKVYVIGRREEKLQNVVDTYGKDIAGEIIPFQADVTNKEDIKRLYDHISKNEPHLDILFNNAGISTVTVKTEASSAEEMKKNMFDPEDSTFEDWDAVYRTNVSQIYFMSTAFLPLLAKASENTRGWSSTIVNISSISGQVKTSQHHPQYNASKAATIHLTRMLANHIAENEIKIRVNSIAPGVFPSEMTANDSDENSKSHIEKEKYAKVPAKRPGRDIDMANAVLFVTTNQYVNGQDITVDGGYTLSAGR